MKQPSFVQCHGPRASWHAPLTGVGPRGAWCPLQERALDALTPKLMAHFDTRGHGAIDAEQWARGYGAYRQVRGEERHRLGLIFLAPFKSQTGGCSLASLSLGCAENLKGPLSAPLLLTCHACPAAG